MQESLSTAIPASTAFRGVKTERVTGTTRRTTFIPTASERGVWRVYEFMAALEDSGLGRAMRGSGVWTYGIVNLIHIVGISTLFGSVLTPKPPLRQKRF